MPKQYSIAIQPSEPRVLLIDREGTGALPAHESNEPPAIREVMRERYGLDATVLGTVGGRYLDTERDEPSSVFALEVHSAPGALPTSARWVDLAELERLPLAAPEQRPLIVQRLREAAGSVEPPPTRVPWARPGWLATASEWIGEQLARLGYAQVGPVAQVRIRPWSAVLRVATSAGDVYFKTSAQPSMAHEVPLTQTLAELFPAQTPRVLAADAARHWMLLADAGESLAPALRHGGDPARYATALATFARFQMATAPYVERLVALGCPDRRLDRLPALFARVIADRDALLVGHTSGLSEPDYHRLRTMIPDVERMSAQLADFNVPAATLHHDEITPGHVIASDEGDVFFDWGDSGITHPLCSLMMPLRWTRFVLGYDAAALAGLRDAYLAAWTGYEPLERLRDAYVVAARLALLCRALTWYDALPHMEPGARWEFDDSAGYFLGLFLNGQG